MLRYCTLNRLIRCDYFFQLMTQLAHPFFQIDLHSSAIFDAVTLYAIAVNACLSNGCDVTDHRAVSQYLFDHTFMGKLTDHLK